MSFNLKNLTIHSVFNNNHEPSHNFMIECSFTYKIFNTSIIDLL